MLLMVRRWWRCSASIAYSAWINCPACSPFRLRRPLNGDLHVDGKVAASGLDRTIQGTLRLSGDVTPWAKLKLQATAGDLRPLHQAMTGQPGTAVPVKADATVADRRVQFLLH